MHVQSALTSPLSRGPVQSTRRDDRSLSIGWTPPKTVEERTFLSPPRHAPTPDMPGPPPPAGAAPPAAAAAAPAPPPLSAAVEHWACEHGLVHAVEPRGAGLGGRHASGFTRHAFPGDRAVPDPSLPKPSRHPGGPERLLTRSQPPRTLGAPAELSACWSTAGRRGSLKRRPPPRQAPAARPAAGVPSGSGCP